MAVNLVSRLPVELRTFLDDFIESVEQLEILLALRRIGQAASARRMTDELGLLESTASAAIAILVFGLVWDVE